jgi:hypothetical protein
VFGGDSSKTGSNVFAGGFLVPDGGVRDALIEELERLPPQPVSGLGRGLIRSTLRNAFRRPQECPCGCLVASFRRLLGRSCRVRGPLGQVNALGASHSVEVLSRLPVVAARPPVAGEEVSGLCDQRPRPDFQGDVFSLTKYRHGTVRPHLDVQPTEERTVFGDHFGQRVTLCATGIAQEPQKHCPVRLGGGQERHRADYIIRAPLSRQSTRQSIHGRPIEPRRAPHHVLGALVVFVQVEQRRKGPLKRR